MKTLINNTAPPWLFIPFNSPTNMRRFFLRLEVMGRLKFTGRVIRPSWFAAAGGGDPARPQPNFFSWLAGGKPLNHYLELL